MTLINPPLWLQNGTYTARHDRLLLSSLIARPGVTTPTGLKVYAQAGPDMSVRIDAGSAFVARTDQPNEGMYHVYNDGFVTRTVQPASPTSPRIDIVVLTVHDAYISGAIDTSEIEVITGNAQSSPVAPDVPDNSILLATINVPLSASSISADKIIDKRPTAKWRGTPITVANAAERNLLVTTGEVFTGMYVLQVDTGDIFIWNGSTWRGIAAGSDVPHTAYFMTISTAFVWPQALNFSWWERRNGVITGEGYGTLNVNPPFSAILSVVPPVIIPAGSIIGRVELRNYVGEVKNAGVLRTVGTGEAYMTAWNDSGYTTVTPQNGDQVWAWFRYVG